MSTFSARLPGNAEESYANSPSERSRLRGFDAEVRPTRHSLSYIVSLLAVGGFVTLLPIAYFVAVGFFGWTLYQHVIRFGTWSTSFIGAAGHLALAFVGSLWMVSLVKPIFSRRSCTGSGARLTRAEEPELYACVDHVFNTVGINPPKFIEVDHDANASARLGDGFWSLLTGKVSVVTIGLPLVAGLDEAQLVGVLGHECGHFKQRFGMRLSTLIRWNILWLGRLVYQQDQIDDWLRHRVATSYCVPCHLLRLFTVAVRGMLWVLLQIGRGTTASLLRQMELDADRYEVKLVGVETFERTVKRMRELGLGQETAIDDMHESFRDGRLTDNYPELVAIEADALADKLAKQLSSAELANKLLYTTHWLDTHPCDGERVANAVAEPMPGRFSSDRPARLLFSDFDGLCRDLTSAMNDAFFGVDAAGAVTVPIDEFVQKNTEELSDLTALREFFSGMFNVERGIRTPAAPIVGGYFGKSITRLTRCAKIMSARHDKFIVRAEQFHHFDTLLRQANGQTVHSHSTDPLADAAPFHQDRDEIDHADFVQMCQMLKTLDGQLATYERIFWVWIESALQLLRSPVAGEISQQARALAREIKLMWTAAAKLYEAVPHYRQLKQQLDEVEEVLEQLNDADDQLELRQNLEETSYRIATELHKAQALLEGVIYPFERKPVRSICCYVFEKAPREEQSAIATAYAFVDRFPTLYARVIGRLTRSAQMVQEAVKDLETT